MTDAVELSPTAARAHDVKVIGLVGAAHFVSHYYLLLVPPLLATIRGDFGVSWVEVGFALVAFEIVSFALQIPAGILVDRVGPRLMLIGGLVLAGIAVAAAALAPTFWLFVAMFAVVGAANAVYHPADYAILSQAVAQERVAPAFSLHTFFGLVGSMVAPGSLLIVASVIGWRGAFLAAAGLALAVAFVLALARADLFASRHPAPPRPGAAGPELPTWKLLIALPILLNLIFFALAATANAGLQNFSMVAVGALHGIGAVLASGGLTSYLAMAALGVLTGGVVAGRTVRHDRVAIAGFIVMALGAYAVGTMALTASGLVIIMGVVGFAYGITMPSRDMLVRSVTPPGAFGRVFGFVSMGFNAGGVISPLMFGWLMDSGRPGAVFIVVALFATATIVPIAANRLWRSPPRGHDQAIRLTMGGRD